MITTDKKIKIFDDTGKGDDYHIEKILYEDETIIVATATNKNTIKPLKVMIEKISRIVISGELLFYLAENY